MKTVWKIIKENKVISIVVSCLVMVLLFGFSYAFFIVQDESNPQTVTTANLDIDYIDGESLNFLNEVPITDDKINDNAASHSISVTNNNNIALYFDIGVKDLSISEFFKSGDLKWMLKEGNIITEGGSFSDVISTEYSFKKGIIIQPGETKNYKLLIWIKDTGGNQNHLMNSSLGGKITITGYIKGSSQEYVTDGLLLHYDGINNTGYGHDPLFKGWGNLGSMADSNLIMENLSLGTNAYWEDYAFNFNYAVNHSSGFRKQKTETTNVGNILTISATFKLSQNISVQGIAGWSYYGSVVARPSILMDNNILATTPNVSTTNINRVVNSNENIQVVVVYNINRIDVYIDGVFYSKHDVTIPNGIPVNSFRLGVYGSTTNTTQVNTGFKGLIYNVKVYDRALSQTEIEHNYLEDVKRFGF